MTFGAIIAWLFTPTGRIVAIALAGLTFVAVIDRRATFRERARCEQAKKESAEAAKVADRAAAEKARAEDKKAIADLQTEKEKADKRNEDLQAQLASVPAAQRCPVTPERLKRLR